MWGSLFYIEMCILHTIYLDHFARTGFQVITFQVTLSNKKLQNNRQGSYRRRWLQLKEHALIVRTKTTSRCNLDHQSTIQRVIKPCYLNRPRTQYPTSTSPWWLRSHRNFQWRAKSLNRHAVTSISPVEAREISQWVAKSKKSLSSSEYSFGIGGDFAAG